MHINLTQHNDIVLWTQTLNNAVNEQINMELRNMLTYEEVSAVMSSGEFGMTGIGNFFRNEATEELKHARKLIDYQLKRGGKISGLSATPADTSGITNTDHPIISAYTFALNLEKETYLSLVALYNTARDDPHCQAFLESMLDEQLTAQKDLSDRVQQLNYPLSDDTKKLLVILHNSNQSLPSSES